MSVKTESAETRGSRLTLPRAAVGVALALTCLATNHAGAQPTPAGGPVPVATSAEDPRDGPILLVVHHDDPFGLYGAEILRAEGLNALRIVDVAALDGAVLATHPVVVLAPGALSAGQVALLRAYVEHGGDLVALRPGAALAELVGLAPSEVTLGNAYYRVDAASARGADSTGRALQFHGVADAWQALPGTRVLATLRTRRDSLESAGAAVTVRDVGERGGHVASFAFDVARSVVWTRQGNPAWEGTERDGARPIRPNDLFYPDWVDLENLDIPQADELQRLLVYVLLDVTAAQLPLPRFAYLPADSRGAVVLTGDDHGSANVPRRLDALLATRSPGCRLDDWTCTNASAYVWPSTALTEEQSTSYRAQGFDLGLHVDTRCVDWTPPSLDAAYGEQLAQLEHRFPSTPAPRTSRTHCIAWSDWATQPKVELAHGIRFDANYYHWPAAWLQGHVGMLTGSALPMRFADRDGTPIDVWQAATQLTDESGQSYPSTLDTLLDSATGPQGYAGTFVANLHSDSDDDVSVLALVDSARRHGMPVISAEQLLTWLDGRDASSFDGLTWDGRALRFTLTAGVGAERLLVWVPFARGDATISWIARGQASVRFTRRTIGGVEVAVFAAGAGTYRVSYAAPRPVRALSSRTRRTAVRRPPG